MFRGCYFEYAGKSSNEYNLQLFYYDRHENKFNSGGEYEVKTEILPNVTEQLLYGLNYSSKSLEFDIEIFNPDGVIPLEQVTEIKNWLFGQDGWKTFRTLDERQDYCLKCLLMPEEDITDTLGYRGFKCKVRNINSFWYGKEKSITIPYEVLHGTNVQFRANNQCYWVPFLIHIPKSDCVESCLIYPNIEFRTTNSTTGTGTSDYEDFNNMYYSNSQNKNFDIGTMDYENLDTFISQSSGLIPSVDGYTSDINARAIMTNEFSSGISFDLFTNGLHNINTRYANIKVGGFDGIGCKAGIRLFNLKTGDNICYLRNPENISYLTFTYTPMYRIGAF